MKIDDNLSLPYRISSVDSFDCDYIKRGFIVISGRSVWKNGSGLHMKKIVIGFEI